jgi:hypothetical protein
MKKIITTIILLSLSTVANAEYMVNYGEVKDLRFVTPSAPEIPEPEPEPVKECQYKWLSTGWMEYPATTPGKNITTEIKWDNKLVSNVAGEVASYEKDGYSYFKNGEFKDRSVRCDGRSGCGTAVTYYTYYEICRIEIK